MQNHFRYNNSNNNNNNVDHRILFAVDCNSNVSQTALVAASGDSQTPSFHRKHSTGQAAQASGKKKIICPLFDCNDQANAQGKKRQM